MEKQPIEKWAEQKQLPAWKFAAAKVLAPGHGFNSERSQRAENGGRP